MWWIDFPFAGQRNFSRFSLFVGMSREWKLIDFSKLTWLLWMFIGWSWSWNEFQQNSIENIHIVLSTYQMSNGICTWIEKREKNGNLFDKHFNFNGFGKWKNRPKHWNKAFKSESCRLCLFCGAFGLVWVLI